MSMGTGGIFGNPSALFGRRKSPFDRVGEMADPFMPQMAPETQGAIDQYAAMPEQKRGGGFFGQGGVGRAIAGYLGDALLRQADMDPIYAPSMMMQQRAKAEAMQAEAMRRAKFQDWRQQYEYERANPKATNNDTINDFNWFKGLNEADRKLYQEMKPVYRQGPDGNFYRVEAGDAANAVPPPSFTPDDWDSGTPLKGGTGGNAGRTFR